MEAFGIEVGAAVVRMRQRFGSVEGLAVNSLWTGLSGRIKPRAHSGEREWEGNRRGNGFDSRFTNSGDDLCSQPSFTLGPSIISSSVAAFYLTRSSSHAVHDINGLQAQVTQLVPRDVFEHPPEPPITPTVTKRGTAGIRATASGCSDPAVSTGRGSEHPSRRAHPDKARL